MSNPQDQAGVLAVLMERFETQRLPRLLELQAKVNVGEKLQNYDLAFLEEVMTDAVNNGPLFADRPEYQTLAARVVGLYKEITEKALANEQAG
jgi:hypothetical protein